MRSRLVAAGLALPAALTLAACASTVQGAGSADGTSPSHSSSSTPSATPTSGTPSASSTGGSTAVTLAARLTKGVNEARTAHIDLQLLADNILISGTGDESLSNGKLVSMDLTETISSVQLGLIIAGGKTYVKLPSQLNKSGKPWQLVRAGSSDATVRALAASLTSTRTSASLSNITELISAARSVRQVGSGMAHGKSTTSYAVDVDPSKLPASFNGRSTIIAAGITSIPVHLVLDSSGRPTRMVENFTIAGQKVMVKIGVSAYNKPVHITAPPASQVSTK